ncbi:hypothetical protein C1I99_03575 [Micromonospora deserti]|uniref:Transposase IS4-like domain-containing protein n=2 Tax=Micromonospora deserti TaxID=2070366 RepID=A0A2W2CRK4_9ACTN|nr:hypothetical protein C1I99_03575 [Micromonospora deserti]
MCVSVRGWTGQRVEGVAYKGEALLLGSVHQWDVHNCLRMPPATARSRPIWASFSVIDSQSVKSADTVGRDSRGYDAGKKINGRKRSIITDTLGLLVTVTVLAASWQDRDGAKTALLSAYMVTPIRYVFADQGFTGRLID